MVEVRFNSSDPSQRDEVAEMLKVNDYRLAVNLMYQDLRREVKHGEHEFVKVQSVFDRFVEIINDYGLEVE